MAIKNYTVEGMTCAHCKASVEEEISELPGVASVDADVASGAVTVSGEGFTDADIHAAVKEAGYTLRA
ncbi:heavy-metal-associated domain-containing protein [Corynebacterium pacaense]|uniref:heavy-metal-associated domain-containing protein n=1 Tax=Corynebacterium pacaense TaxID=1816684 RepID=UPI0009B9CE57|nr:heavy-metal-associated domain-containing protein [Corynebacterium pacaense]